MESYTVLEMYETRRWGQNARKIKKKELKQISEAQMSLKNSLYKQVLHSSDQDGVGYQLTMVDW